MEDALFIFIFGVVFGALVWFADRVEVGYCFLISKCLLLNPMTF